MTTCDLCGREVVQEINELPEDWIAVIEGGRGSEYTFDEGFTYGCDNRVIGSFIGFAFIKGREGTVICPDCRYKLGMRLPYSPQEDDR